MYNIVPIKINVFKNVFINVYRNLSKDVKVIFKKDVHNCTNIKNM
jgi:hypothetical protein